MSALKYTVIRTSLQYDDYCNALEELLVTIYDNEDSRDEIDLLTLLIEKWDADHSSINEVDPVALIHSLMLDHHLKAKDLAEILEVSKGLVSDILNYKKGLSKDNIRILSACFKVSQEAFNRPYRLKKMTGENRKKKIPKKVKNA
jgi:HTH-type transcriptional regulator / antitoxin HigA